MRKTTKTQYRKFCTAFRKWQRRFGLAHYDIEFEHGGCDEGNIAEIDADPENCVASVSFATKSDVDPEPELTGLHEAIHLLLSRYHMLALRRSTTEQDIIDEEERIVRTLDKIIDGAIRENTKSVRG